MIFKLFAILLMTNCAICMPQFITFKDGKFGVNFAGYHAEAGLGGLLTGNAAHGGLSASAGTPHGQRAGAGLAGQTGRDIFGGAFAGATAGEGIGANAGLSGSRHGGVLGAESYAGGKRSAVIKTIGPDQVDSYANSESDDNVQKIKPPKKYTGIPPPDIIAEKRVEGPILNTHVVVDKIQSSIPFLNPSEFNVVKNQKPLINAVSSNYNVPINNYPVHVYGKRSIRPFRRRHLRKQYYYRPIAYDPIVYQPVEKVVETIQGTKNKQLFLDTRIDNQPAEPTVVVQKPLYTSTATVQNNQGSNFFDNIFNIPISTLRAVNQFLNQGVGQGGVGFKKNVQVSTSVDNHNKEVAPVEITENKKPITQVEHSVGVEAQIGGSSFFDNIFNIPISTLRAVNELLNGKVNAQGRVGVKKTLAVTNDEPKENTN